jgi:UDP-glucose 4-epimerase
LTAVARSRSRLDAVHDVSLAAWALLAAARAAGRHRAGAVDAAVVGINLLTGSPAALHRVRRRRRDPVALLAPAAVLVAVVATAGPRQRWAPIASVAVLVGLLLAERTRFPR